MPSIVRILAATPAFFSVAYSQGVITSAQGTKGSPASLPLQVQLGTTDANIINTTEINANVVNECGRTLLGGNIDVGANTEDQLANKTVTSVTKGSKVAVTIDQVNAQGAGPYSCDMDLQNNADGATGQTKLDVQETDNNNGQISLSVTMPANMSCIGSSTGNICTVRCFNTAAAGPFGGCFAVQQTDKDANANTPSNIVTAQTLEGVNAQIAENQADLSTAVSANSAASLDLNDQGVKQVDALLGIDSTASATAKQAVATNNAATNTNTGKGTGKANGKGTAKAAGNKANRTAREFSA